LIFAVWLVLLINLVVIALYRHWWKADTESEVQIEIQEQVQKYFRMRETEEN
jgi:hypothetical protein